jgi:hypothetical protein
VLAFGTQVRGVRIRPKPSDFEKILTTPSFEEKVKPSVPYRSFTACKTSLNVTCNSTFKQNSRTFLAHSSNVCRWVLSRGDACRRLVAKVGTSNTDRTISLKRLQCVVENKHKHEAAPLLGSWVRIPLMAWKFVSCICCAVLVAASVTG